MRLCFFGDSFVNGTGDPDCLGWVGRVCAAERRRGHDLTVYNLGIRRDTSADLARRWQDEAQRRLPLEQDGRLVFSFGANDCVIEDGRRRVGFEQTLRHAGTILTAASALAPTLMIGPPPLAEGDADARIAPLSAALGGCCRQLGVPFLDPFPDLAASGAWRREAAAGDGAHPGQQGYAELAALVAAWPAWRAWFR
ncbi:MAG: GDSL family lipase [Azospirillum sp.]|nr:GDSL family lipase [Azospirillum sp.]